MSDTNQSDDVRYVSMWECPECGITKNASNMCTQQTDTVPNYCSHCQQHGWGDNEMIVKEYQNTDQ